MPEGLVLLIDDDKGVLESIDAILTVAGFQVIAFASASEFLEQLESLAFACIVTDVHMPEISGLALVERLKASGRGHWPVIVISGHADIPMAVAAMKAGASNFLEKPFGSGALVQAISDAFAARGPSSGLGPELENARSRIARLSRREREVLGHLVNGASSKVAALVLGISPRTVDIHRGNILKKMQVPNVAALATLVGRGLLGNAQA